MTTFDTIEEGDVAKKRVTLPLLGATFNIESGKWDGPTIDLDLVALSPGEDLEVIRRSREMAKRWGSERLEEGDATYDYATSVQTILIASHSVLSTPKVPIPFFKSGEEGLLKSKRIGQDQISYLFELQKLHQDAVSPRRKDLTPSEFMATTVAVAGGNLDFFVALRPSTRWVFTRTLAAQHIDSLTRKSPSTSPESSTSEASTPTG